MAIVKPGTIGDASAPWAGLTAKERLSCLARNAGPLSGRKGKKVVTTLLRQGDRGACAGLRLDQPLTEASWAARDRASAGRETPWPPWRRPARTAPEYRRRDQRARVGYPRRSGAGRPVPPGCERSAGSCRRAEGADRERDDAEGRISAGKQVRRSSATDAAPIRRRGQRHSYSSNTGEWAWISRSN